MASPDIKIESDPDSQGWKNLVQQDTNKTKPSPEYIDLIGGIATKIFKLAREISNLEAQKYSLEGNCRRLAVHLNTCFITMQGLPSQYKNRDLLRKEQVQTLGDLFAAREQETAWNDTNLQRLVEARREETELLDRIVSLVNTQLTAGTGI
ncbi:hypothetical protein BT63DRAFT_430217 [Microthyrium microscopicum]|uniref:Uncharacterized protein n=1 Tax=Microthyrium microscopicum TaxID=703497 RepID=A0A6A6TW52_9PEZI|nr:hypothetical protein BT63DRAFT_430217 [Microthyrium microscopicum]